MILYYLCQKTSRRATLKNPERLPQKIMKGKLCVFLIPLLISLAIAPVAAREPRRDELTGKVRLLYIGDYVGADTPARLLEQEPLLSVRGVPATLAWYQEKFIRKFMRIYMPRSYDDLVGKNDVILFSDAGVRLFESRHFDWFEDAVIEDAMGMVMIGGVESFGAEPGRPAWMGTTVMDILPVEGVFQSFNPNRGVVEIVATGNEFISSLPWDTLTPPMNTFDRFNNLVLKEGAELLAYLTVGRERHPFLCTWMQGEGQTFAMGSDWTPGGGVHFMKWDYYGDYASNLVLYVAGVEVPAEHELRHAFKSLLEEYEEQKTLLMATLDFVERFNANSRPLLLKISENDDNREKAEDLYMEQDFQPAVDRMNQVVNRIEELTEESLDLRDRSLFWVYVIEYLTVIGTCLITGTIVYTLMIRRRLYREVEVTRGRSRRI